MEFKALQIAALINGTIEGDEHQQISTIAKIEEASGDALCFIANPKYEHYLYETKAAIVIINESLKLQHEVKPTLIRVPDAYAAFATLMEMYQQMNTPKKRNGIEPNSFIHETAVLGKDVYVGAFAYVGENVHIADNVEIFPHAYIGNDVKIGKNSKIN